MATHKTEVFSDIINTTFIWLCVKSDSHLSNGLKVMKVTGMTGQMGLMRKQYLNTNGFIIQVQFDP